MGSTLTETTRANTRLRLLAGNPLLFAAGFMTLGFISLLGWISRGAASQAAALGALVIAIETVFIWSLSRGAMLASLPIIFAAIWYIRPRPLRLFVFLIGLAASTVVLEYSGAYGSRLATMSSRVSQGMTTVATGEAAAEKSTGNQMQLFSAGLEAWMARPVFGHGVSERYNAAVPYLKQDFGRNFSHLHNAFLTHLVGGGVVGLGLLLFMLVTPFLANHSCRKSTGALSKDSRYFAWVVFLSLSGIGLSNLILNQDVSSHLFGILLVVHLLIANHDFQS
ncbi:MAG: O-antigen ligase domain-containing protein, partial [Rhodobacteraceae bacterium]|nr:O-antigen ligase domain-containing protein [Paracoccaceae bacterium]